jgi:ubiquinone/menaquinone biosynthesis C-methylase UbiE
MSEERNTMEAGRGVEKYSYVFGFASPEDFKSELEGKQVLDAGSGEGNLKKELGGEFNITNLDVRHMLGSKSVQAMGEFMPFKENSFDTILCNHSLFFYGQDKDDMTLEDGISKQAQETFRVLKSNGKLHIILLPLNREYEVVPTEDSKFVVYTSVERRTNEISFLPTLKVLKNVGFNIDKVENFKMVDSNLVQTRAVLSKNEN